MTKNILSGLLLISALLNFSKAEASRTLPTDNRCVIGQSQPATGFWTWPIGSEVNIYLRAPDFSSGYEAAIETAIRNWNAAASENGSSVHFTLRGITKDSPNALGDLTLVRGDVFTKKEKHLALLEAHSLHHDQSIDYAFVIVDNRVKNPDVLTNVIAHELGHSLGLMDCYHCADRSTAMGLMKSANEANSIDGPTPCDTLAVQREYREVSARVKPGASNPKVEKIDVGEEPEADDTPIIKPPMR